ncbi:calcium-binding protein [Falsiroseomonas sp. CW058]|uniref:calcium-binding protein n=1 Tax=Falsiroseomonas sp. CW058 TaxID=3388664 RepID=UPI003D311ACA
MDLNLLVRGQSNAMFLMEYEGGAGPALVSEVQRLLGFDGVNDRVRLVYDSDGSDGAATAFGGTRLIGDWLLPRNGDWRQGWDLAELEQSILATARGLPATRRDDPTAVLWLHSESDSTRFDLTTEEWVSAVRFDAAQLRAALGQGAATTPYLFVSAMPYWGNPDYFGTDEGTQAIRRGMEQLAADAGFHAAIAARIQDVDMDGDFAGAYGGGHIDAQDAMQTALRSARAVAEAFAQYAKAGSPVALAGGNIADEGPQVVAATRVGANQLRIDVLHDAAGGFRALDADAASGLGWTVRLDGGAMQATAASIVDADTLLLTFSAALPAEGRLFYAHGYGRLTGADGSARGNAVYDDQGLPIWVAAGGLALPPGSGGTAIDMVVPGTAGDDWLKGGAGADTLTGGAGSDDLQGGAGNDVLAGGRDHDGLTLGAGADTVVFARGDGVDWIVDFTPGTDRLLMQGYAAGEAVIAAKTYWGMAGTEIRLAAGDSIFLQGVTAFRAADVTWGGGTTQPPPPPPPPPAGLLVNGSVGDDWLKGGTGADTLNGGAGSDDLQGLAGNDRLSGGRGHDGLTLGAGADTVAYARGDGWDWVVDFTPGTDRLELSGITAGGVVRTAKVYWDMAGLELSFGAGDVIFLQGVSTLGAGDIVFT